MQWGGGRWQQATYNGGMYPGGGMGMSPMSIQQQQQLAMQQMMMQQQIMMQQQQMAQQMAMEQELAMRRELALRNEAALTQSALQNAAKNSVAMQRLQASASDVKSTVKVVKNFRETAKDAATARSKAPEGALDVVLTLQNIRLGEALKCTIVLRLNTAQKTTVDGVALVRPCSVLFLGGAEWRGMTK